ncbi:hypothetical protein GCM10023353_34400 [Tomitella cavernea]|uniref:Type IV toxin-antitoxin system AbiEi family antitoxin domain-containing protein n=2 Tax=Tomitella cavernea TaxID=1387982 RepID=A0ABP9D215_9ACTN
MTPTKVQFRRDLLGLGYTDHRLGSMCERDQVTRLRRGAYVSTDALGQADALERHRLQITAAVHDLRRPAAVSHVSAAVVLGLPLWNADGALVRVHMTRSGSGNGNSNVRKIMHSVPLPDDQVIEFDGISVTSAARTIVDIAGMGLFEQAVCMGDHALNNALISVDDLDTALGSLRGCKGAAQARAAVRAMDLRSESVGETRCRLLLTRLGLAPTSLQRVVRYEGKYIARVDFSHDDEGIVGEFDGMVKYRLHGQTGEAQSRALADEKAREERLTSLGLKVVRIVWKDLVDPDAIVGRYSRARTLARNSPPPLWDPPRQSDVYLPRPR